ncbi:mannosyltransferase putative-domain-containing protein [Zopfochytrium polystomum]|nr:mannosyltransferase putative-domain-containing protein [Zopfochytrium polystomum]
MSPTEPSLTEFDFGKLYNTGELGIIPGSRGIVFTGPGKTVQAAIMAVSFLRRSGCQLPVEYAYLADELTSHDVHRLRSFNITPRNFLSKRISSYEWTPSELRFGASKVDAIITSPFEEVMYLDADVFVLRDPSYLFETNAFRKFGALFWPDFPSTAPSNPIWKIMGQKYQLEREFETGLVVVDKKRVWSGLRLAQHMCAEAKFYFQHIWGDKDTFRWAFKATNTPYFLNPNYLQSIGIIASPLHPKGNEHLSPTPPDPSRSLGRITPISPREDEREGEQPLPNDNGNGRRLQHRSGPPPVPGGGRSSDEFPALPPPEYLPHSKARFCGQNMLQMDFDDDADWLQMDTASPAPSGASVVVPGSKVSGKMRTGRAPANQAAAISGVSDKRKYAPAPLFMHANGIKRISYDGVPPFQVGMAYVDRRPPHARKAGVGGEPGVTSVDDFEGSGARWIGSMYLQRECVELIEVDGLEIRMWSGYCCCKDLIVVLTLSSSSSDWSRVNPDLNELYIEERRKANAFYSSTH